MSIDFLGFGPEVPRRFDSVVVETLMNAPGALAFDKVLEFRKRLKQRHAARTDMLPGEETIRSVW
jgi:hypothetical protein